MNYARLKHAGWIPLLALLVSQPLAARENNGAATNFHSLWKVEGKTNVVYLLGSIHVLKPENFPLAAPLESAFSNSEVAVFEADEEKMSEPEVQADLLKKVQLPAGETLKDHLSSETYAAFVSRVKADGLPTEAFDSMKPGMAAMALGMIELDKLGVHAEHGIDKHFMEKTRKEGKQIVFLETVDFQIGLVTDFSKEEEELLMKVSLKEMNKISEEYGDLIKAWQTGDSAGLEKMINESFREVTPIYKRLVTDRSRNWAPRIEEFVRSGKNTIVIVGAGHLVGSEGVVELLKKKGFKVTQL